MARIFKRGKVWYLDFTYRGRRIRKAVGKDKKTAELALKDIEVRIAKEEHLGIHENKRVLFKDFAKDYLGYSKVNKAPGSYRRDKTNIKNLSSEFKGKFLSEISIAEIEKYKARRIKKVSPASVNRELACLSHMFTLAIRWGIVSRNPMRGIKKLKEPPGRLRFLTVDEIGRLIRACSPHLKPIVITALNTGMRKSEILNLKWKDVDFVNRTITVRKSKNNEVRIIPINGVLYKILKNLHRFKKSEWVFPGKDGKPLGDFKRAFKTALRRAGIEDFRFHDLRHTFASHLVMNGVNIRTVQQLLGHKDIKMTMKYSHLSRDFVQEAVSHLDGIWGKFRKIGTNLAQKEFDNSVYPCKLLSINAAPVAQLDRALDYESKGRRFESCRARFFAIKSF